MPQIYWIWDMRPEVITAAFPNGRAFYCGVARKRALTSVLDQRRRSRRMNRNSSLSRHLVVRVAECGAHLRIQAMESFDPSTPDEVIEARLSYWISTILLLYPDCAHRAVKRGRKPLSGHFAFTSLTRS